MPRLPCKDALLSMMNSFKSLSHFFFLLHISMGYFLVRKMKGIFLYGLSEEHGITPTLASQAVRCSAVL